jgi:RHS repeat-associated protein
VWRFYYRGASPERSGGDFAGTQRVAMRVQGDPTPGNNGVFYFLTDHLGSTTVTVNSAGSPVGELRYRAFGVMRFASGSPGTEYRYTGQRLEEGIGLYYYRARLYDPSLARFVQAGSVAPGDRYAYVLNNPLRYTDPSGHRECDDQWGCEGPRHRPEPIDPVDLSEGGLEMALLYSSYASTPGSWNEGGTAEFEPEQFMVLMLSFEFWTIPNPGDPNFHDEAFDPGYDEFHQALLESSAAWFQGVCNYYTDNALTGGTHGCLGPSPNAIFNWLSGSQSAGERYAAHFDQEQSLAQITNLAQTNIPLAQEVVDYVMDPGNWQPFVWPNPNAMYWGNRELFALSPNDVGYVARFGSGDYEVENAMYIVTEIQNILLHGGQLP